MFLGKTIVWRWFSWFQSNTTIFNKQKFHNNIDINNDILSKFPFFYQDIFIKWINNYTAKPKSCLSSFGLTQILRLNYKIVNLKYIGQIFNDNENIKPWKD